MAAIYLDSSALVKLVLAETESDALADFIAMRPERVTCAIAVVEVVRAARRASPDPAVERRAYSVLSGTHLLSLADTLLKDAARLSPLRLRTLDALHLAAARRLGGELQAMVVYDEQLAGAARAAGLPVVAPC